MKVIGIDPGYALVGFSIIEFFPETYIDRGSPQLISYGVIKTDQNLTYKERFKEIFENLEIIYNSYKPEIASVERVYFTKNKKTVMEISEIRGALNLFFLYKKIEVVQFTPLEIKKIITGNGKAKKKEIQIFIKSFFNMDEIPTPDDASDAIATALACFFNYNKYFLN
ncbi:MAG: crossover junction endodeoxyribonuclease RuvC [Spirochaetes bacterium]|nr:crossover junction endodeoxyribonuclease RuvC [Spirochaetota bacterium]